MENNLVILKASIDDKKNIFAIESSIKERILADNVICQELDSVLHPYYIAKLDGNPVGYAALTKTLDHVDLTSIAVVPSKRHQGIAQMILTKVLEDVSPLPIYLEVNENNLPAVSLYEKVGFKKISTRFKYYNNLENAYIYCYTF